MTRGIQERHHAAGRVHVVSPDVLGDAAGFARRHLGTADVIEQGGLAVVDVTHHGHHRRTRHQFGMGRRHFLFGEGFRIVQRSRHRCVAQLLNHDHRGVLVERLVDGHHLAQLHELFDDLGRLDRHLVRQFGHGDGFGHVHLDDLGFDRRAETGFAIVPTTALAAFGASTPIAAATASTTGVTARLQLFLLVVFVLPGGRQGLGLDFFLARTRRSCRGFGRRPGRLVQGAFDARLGFSRLGLFRLLGHQHFFRGRHHGADGLGFGQGFAATLVQILGALFFRQLFSGLALLLGGKRMGLVLSGFFFGRGLSGFGLGVHRTGLAVLQGLFGSRLGTRFAGLALGLLAGGGLLTLAFGLGRCAGFGFLALFALLGQLFFLTTQQLGLLACLLLATGQFFLVNHRCGRGIAFRRLVIAFDEGALFAHLDLDGSGTARGIGLLDFGGGFFGQGDLLALTRGGAVAGLQVAQQALLVVFGNRVGTRPLFHAGAGQLLQQQGGRFVQFGGEFCDGIT